MHGSLSLYKGITSRPKLNHQARTAGADLPLREFLLHAVFGIGLGIREDGQVEGGIHGDGTLIYESIGGIPIRYDQTALGRISTKKFLILIGMTDSLTF